MLNQFAHALLVATSLAPVSLVYGLSYLPDDRATALQWIGVAAGLVVACLGVMWGASKTGERETVMVSKTKNVDKDVLAFLVSYALPLISPVHTQRNAIAFWAFMAIVAVVLFQAELVHVNPLLGILGYRFYALERDDGSAALLVTRSKTGAGETKSVIKLSAGLWLESPDA